MLSVYYNEVKRKFEKYEVKKYSMLDDKVMEKVLDKIKESQSLNNLMILKQ